MTTRKRSAAALYNSVPPKAAVRLPGDCTRPFNPRDGSGQLLHQGFAVVRVPYKTYAALAIAAKALQGQLELCSEQPVQNRYAGFKSFPRKQLLEYHKGSPVFQDLTMLQHLNNEVNQ